MIPAPGAPLSPEDIYTLAGELARRDFTVGTDQVIAAVDLCLAVSSSAQPPETFADYKYLLAPLFARSKDEQARFYALFDSWQAGKVQALGSHDLPPPPAPPTPPMPRVRVWPFVTWGAGALALAYAVLELAQMVRSPTPRPAAQHVAAPASDARPASETGATQPAPAADGGSVVAKHTGGKPAPAPAPTPAEVDSLPAGPARPITPSGILGHRPAVVKPASTWWRVLSLVPILGQLLWWLWRWRWRAVWLRHARLGGSLDVTRFRVRGAAEGIVASDLLRRLVGNLRVRRRLMTRDLDPQATVAASVASGFVRPIFRRRTAVPEYLILVDQTDYRDQLARHTDAFVRLLRKEGVDVEILHFSSDPRSCRRPPPDRLQVTLDELAVRERHRRAIIVGDGAALVDGHDRLIGWARAFDGFTDVALLSTRPADHWDARERTLAGEGWIVLPFDGAGLDVLGRTMAARAEQGRDAPPVQAPPAIRTRFPSLLEHDAERWLDPMPPPPERVANLHLQLRAYLGGDGAQLLSVAAIYPRIDNGLLLFLDRHLLTSQVQRATRPDRLLRLARLPWFRHGFMPTYLRAALVTALTEEQLAAATAAFELLFSSVIDATPARGDEDLPVIEIARRPKPLPRWLRPILRSAPAGAPLRDVVLAEVMSRRRAGRLAVSLPREVGRRFRGPRLADVLRPAVVLLASIALWQAPARLRALAGADVDRSGRVDTAVVVAGTPRAVEGGQFEVPLAVVGAKPERIDVQVGLMGHRMVAQVAPAKQASSIACAVVYPWFEGMYVDSDAVADEVEHVFGSLPPDVEAVAVPFGNGYRMSERATAGSLADGRLAEAPLIPWGQPTPALALDAARKKLAESNAPARILVLILEGSQDVPPATAAPAPSPDPGAMAVISLMGDPKSALLAATLSESNAMFARTLGTEVAYLNAAAGTVTNVVSVDSARFSAPWWRAIVPAPATATISSGSTSATVLVGRVGAGYWAAVATTFCLVIAFLWIALRWPPFGVGALGVWFAVVVFGVGVHRAAPPASGHVATPSTRTAAPTAPPVVTPAQRMIKAAEAEVGAHEEPPGSNDGPALRKYFEAASVKPGLPWAGVFVSWVIAQSGRENLPRSGSIAALTAAFKKLGMYHEVDGATKLEPGDLFFIQRTPASGSGGIVTSVNGAKIVTIEGNAGAGGDRVFRRERTLDQINGYVRIPNAAPPATPSSASPDHDVAVEAWRHNVPDVDASGDMWSILVPIQGSIVGASYRTSKRPPAVTVNLPQAESRLTMPFYKIRRGGFRQLWIKQEKGKGATLRFVLDQPADPIVEIKEDFVRVRVPQETSGGGTSTY